MCPVTGFCRCFTFQIGKSCSQNCILRNFQFRKFPPVNNYQDSISDKKEGSLTHHAEHFLCLRTKFRSVYKELHADHKTGAADNIAVAQGLSVYAVFAFICILWAYYQRSPFRFYTILHRFRLSVNMQMNRIRFCLHIPHNTNVFRCRLCSNHNTVPMIRLALK